MVVEQRNGQESGHGVTGPQLGTNSMSFGLFDPKQDYHVSWGHLPHWEQAGATYFITWRTEDSLPRSVLKTWIAERDHWLIRNGIRVPSDAYTQPDVPEHLSREYRSFISDRWETRLDECHGECVLRRPELAEIVGKSLLHFDGDRYSMGDFIVMPNHVHMLVCFPGEDQLKSQCKSWKRFTATQINQRLNRRGEFWQAESFDHLVRSPEAFENYRQYIANNPKWAKLKEGEYLYYRAEKCGPVTP